MPWEDGFWPDAVWTTLENAVPFAALVAFLSSFVWLWKRDPALLIKYGPDWLTRLGHNWNERRDS